MELPSELIEKIFGDINQDQATLKSCSLVCYSWRVLAQQLLFKRISLSTLTLVTAAHRLLTTSPQVIPYIRALAVTGSGRTREVWVYTDPKLPVILSMLVGHLRAIELAPVQIMLWSDFPPAFQSSFNDVLRSPTVHSLSIGMVSNVPLDVLTTPPSLSVLTLSMSSFISQRADFDCAISPHIRFLKEMTIAVLSPDHLNALISFLCTPECRIQLSQLRTLTLRCPLLNPTSQLFEIFALPVIEEIELICSHSSSRNLQPIDFSPYQRLKKLNWTVGGVSCSDLIPLPWLASSLQTTAPYRTSIDLTIYLYVSYVAGNSDLNFPDSEWDDLSDVACELGSVAAVTVTIRLCLFHGPNPMNLPSVTFSEIKSAFLVRLSRMAEMKILAVKGV